MDLAVQNTDSGYPCAPGPLAAGVPAAVPRRAERPSPTRPLSILHLEDAQSDADLAREHLALEGICCVVNRVETQDDFRAAVREGGIDLILADYQLPDFDGLSAFAIARTYCPDVPFLILTGKLGEEYAIDTLKLGVTDYILKQHLATRLAPAVLRALDEQQERIERREAQDQLSRYREHLEELVQSRTVELEERNAQLAAANRDLEGFLATATHDLRTPLVIISGFTRRLEKTCAERLDAANLENLRSVIATTDRMNHLLDDLLGFFRALKASPIMIAIDMERMVREVYAELLPLLGERQAHLELSPLPEAFGDPAMIRQVLVNLIANAIKYTGPREKALIEVSGWEEPELTAYCVKDNGVGFDMRSSGRLFELFQRLHEPSAFSGTGVGLAAVKRILEKHGGCIRATGTPGQGASFFFTLPRGTATSGPRAAGGCAERSPSSCS
jgi:signal transduction histidine kinase